MKKIVKVATFLSMVMTLMLSLNTTNAIMAKEVYVGPTIWISIFFRLIILVIPIYYIYWYITTKIAKTYKTEELKKAAKARFIYCCLAIVICYLVSVALVAAGTYITSSPL